MVGARRRNQGDDQQRRPVRDPEFQSGVAYAIGVECASTSSYCRSTRCDAATGGSSSLRYFEQAQSAGAAGAGEQTACSRRDPAKSKYSERTRPAQSVDVDLAAEPRGPNRRRSCPEVDAVRPKKDRTWAAV